MSLLDRLNGPADLRTLKPEELSTLAAEYAQKLRARGDLESAFAYLELARDPAASRPTS